MTPEGVQALQEALAVTNRIQNKHALMIEDHQRWLEAMQKWQEEHARWAVRIDRLIDQIAAKQLANQEALEKLIEALRRGGNGRERP